MLIPCRCSLSRLSLQRLLVLLKTSLLLLYELTVRVLRGLPLRGRLLLIHPGIVRLRISCWLLRLLLSCGNKASSLRPLLSSKESVSLRHDGKEQKRR